LCPFDEFKEISGVFPFDENLPQAGRWIAKYCFRCEADSGLAERGNGGLDVFYGVGDVVNAGPIFPHVLGEKGFLVQSLGDHADATTRAWHLQHIVAHRKRGICARFRTDVLKPEELEAKGVDVKITDGFSICDNQGVVV
jgi:hypothetical protein